MSSYPQASRPTTVDAHPIGRERGEDRGALLRDAGETTGRAHAGGVPHAGRVGVEDPVASIVGVAVLCWEVLGRVVGREGGRLLLGTGAGTTAPRRAMTATVRRNNLVFCKREGRG